MRDGEPDDWPLGHQPTLAETLIGGWEVWCQCGWHSPSTESTTRDAYDGWRKHLIDEIEGRTK